MEQRISKLKKEFLTKFSAKPEDLFSSPGRIELLGNHTDHNNGKVLVASINLNILAVTSKNNENKVNIVSLGFNEFSVDLNDLEKDEKEFYSTKALIKGVLFKLKELNLNIGGVNIVCDSTIFKGAGVSSSAAFEVLISKIMSYYYNNDEIKPIELAKIAQFAECEYFNKPCGLLDQSGIALGGVNFIDFKDTQNPIIKTLKVNIPDYQFILINTKGDHAHLSHCYSQIKDDMKDVASFYNKEVLRQLDKKISDLETDELLNKTLPQRAILRAIHFINENKRVEKACNSLIKNDYLSFFDMIEESGKSSYFLLKNCYVEKEDEPLPFGLKKVKELDPCCYHRVHGGGFAGTLLMVSKKDKLDFLLKELHEYFGKENVILVEITNVGTTHIKTFDAC